MIGPAMAVENDPLAPTIARSSAPPRGNRSDVIPSIVGHQNATPAAKSAAAANAAAGVLAAPNKNSPAAAATAVLAMSVVGDSRCAAPPRNCRITYMMPFTHTSTRMPACAELFITSLKMLLTHWPGPSSVAAVSHMQNQMTMKSGRKISLNMSPNGTPAAARSVDGNVWPANRSPYHTDGTSINSIFACQPV